MMMSSVAVDVIWSYPHLGVVEMRCFGADTDRPTDLRGRLT
jgi:hypothetical protein